MKIETAKQTHSVSLNSGYFKTIEIKVSGRVEEVDDFYKKVVKLAFPEPTPEPPTSAFKKVRNYALRIIDMWRKKFRQG